MSAPKTSESVIVTFPREHVMLVRLNRPKVFNAMSPEMDDDLERVFDWFDENPQLWVGIITGTGRGFCAGADLKAWHDRAKRNDSFTERIKGENKGFGSLSRRTTRKPIIAALNGHSFGGGTELLLNCDIVIGCEDGMVGLPEVKRGVVACVGGIPNLVAKCPSLIPYVLTGRPFPQRLLHPNVLTEVVTSAEVVPTALKWADYLCQASPDAVFSTKNQLNLIKQGKGLEEVVLTDCEDPYTIALHTGQNIKEGLAAFKEKRDPKWYNPNKLSKL